jgi:hypothetical protein
MIMEVKTLSEIDIAALLPYGLEFIMTSDFNDEYSDCDFDDGILDEGTVWKWAGFADGDLNIPIGDGELDGFIFRNKYTYISHNIKNGGIKPLLLPLSCLTELITHNGETFVPIAELAKLEGSYSDDQGHRLSSDGQLGWGIRWNIENDDDDETHQVFAFDNITNSFGVHYRPSLSWKIAANQRDLFQKLLEWHFDINNLIADNLAIDKRTLK